MSEHKDPSVLSFNKTTGYYEGYLHIQVDAEIFRRMLLQAIEEDEASDLTDPQTWARAVAQVGKVTSWLGKPHVKVAPIALPSDTPKAVAPASPSAQLGIPKNSQIHNEREQRLRERARQTPPYLWNEQCTTPPLDLSHAEVERDKISRLRYRKRQILKQIREEWKQGIFVLTPLAEQQEQEYQATQQATTAATVEAIASAVNGNRHQ